MTFSVCSVPGAWARSTAPAIPGSAARLRLRCCLRISSPTRAVAADSYSRRRRPPRLNHPHIITIYEIDTAAANDFIVMEYVRGKSLDALIPRQGMRLSEALSAPGTLAGTAAYMSPEQATGGQVDARSDIFGFGAMLYEMVTGARAFAGTSTADTLRAGHWAPVVVRKSRVIRHASR
jgi:hypothetical protein